MSEAKYSIQYPPKTVQFTAKVEIYRAGDIVIHQNGMYKYSGAVFGVSIARVIEALNNGHAIVINP